MAAGLKKPNTVGHSCFCVYSIILFHNRLYHSKNSMQRLHLITSCSSQVVTCLMSLSHSNLHFLSLLCISSPALTAASSFSPQGPDSSWSRACVRAASASDSLRSGPWCWGNFAQTLCTMVLIAWMRSVWRCRAASILSLVDVAW